MSTSSATSMGSMSMAAMTSSAPSSTMSGMSMGGSTDMPMMASNMTMMSMDQMAMVFFTANTTPLYSSSWAPNGTGQYAGTCIFLIFFAALFRLLMVLRVCYFEILAAAIKHRDDVTGRSREKNAERRPWKFSEGIVLAAIDTVLAGVGYLLMLAVMTMNVGYFLSVLGGVFLGSVLFGQFLGNRWVGGSH